MLRLPVSMPPGQLAAVVHAIEMAGVRHDPGPTCRCGWPRPRWTCARASTAWPRWCGRSWATTRCAAACSSSATAQAQRVKILWYADGGLTIYYKRLERGTFQFPAVGREVAGHLQRRAGEAAERLLRRVFHINPWMFGACQALRPASRCGTSPPVTERGPSFLPIRRR